MSTTFEKKKYYCIFHSPPPQGRCVLTCTRCGATFKGEDVKFQLVKDHERDCEREHRLMPTFMRVCRLCGRVSISQENLSQHRKFKKYHHKRNGT